MRARDHVFLAISAVRAEARDARRVERYDLAARLEEVAERLTEVCDEFAAELLAEDELPGDE